MNEISSHVVTCTLKNEKLKSNTKAIESLMLSTKRNMFEIVARLLIIKKEELYIEDNFNDVFEYANVMFGYKRNMVYKMITVAEKYIETNPKGGYISILSHDGDDYNISQLMELNVIECDTAIKLNDMNIISPEMTTKEIREVVKNYKRGEQIIQETEDSVQNENSEKKTSKVPTKEVDETTQLLIELDNKVEKLLNDEHIIKDVKTVKTLQEFKRFIEQINL